MTNPGPTQEEYDSLIYKLATLDSELGQARKLLEAPAKLPWWRRFWGLGPKMAVVALVMVLLLGAGAWGKGRVVGYWNGNEYLEASEAAQAGYVMGVVDGFRYVSTSTSDGGVGVDLFVKPIGEMTSTQVHAIVTKYMKENPQLWHGAMAGLVYVAVKGAIRK